MEACTAFLLFFAIWRSTYAQDFYLAAPSSLRLNDDVTVAIAVDGNSEAEVDVWIQDYPGRGKNVSQVAWQVRPGLPEIFTVRLDVNSFPEDFLTAPVSPKLVSLNACFLDNHKEILIPISSQSGYMFIQTDKPIYKPKQKAFFRMVSLTEELLPSKDPFQLQIRNPDNIIVEKKTFNGTLDETLASHVYEFPTLPVFGEWSATVLFGHDLEQNSTVRFQLEDYASPRFTVKLKTPDVILPDAHTVTIEVSACHVYGKRVKGTVSFSLFVKSEHAARPIYFAGFLPRELYEGEHRLRIKLDYLKYHKDIGWFPGIDKSRLVVEATVVDYATGNKERATDSKAIFSNSPFLISFKRCLSDFKPGLISIFEVDITYVDGRPAEGVSTRLTAVADDGQPLRVVQNTVRSDASGRVAFELQPELHHKTVRLTLETNDPKYGGNQANSTFEQHAFISPSRAYIAISKSSHLTLKPGDTYTSAIYFEPAGLKNIYYLVVTRGKILKMEKLPAEPSDPKMEIQITHDMVPDFRVVVFAHHGNELLADSLKIEVDTECNPGAEVIIEPEFYSREPGSLGRIVIRGSEGVTVGLLGVDEAVYSMSRNELLTKKKMFDKLSSHDLGCGPGGGVDVNAVLGNAGIALGTNKYTPSLPHSCDEIKRRKRETEKEISRRLYYLPDDDEPDFMEETEETTIQRKDFKETWIFENIIIGPDGRAELSLRLPRGITTWVIHAVSVSPQHGICVADNKKLVSFKSLSLHLSLPYSVVRNEQVEIQATVLNYGERSIRAIVYMYGAKDLCSGTEPNKKSERKLLVVDAQSAASVSFLVIPLNIGQFNIKVVVLSPVGSDVIDKQLHVVELEGITKEIDIPIKLDPTNQQGRKQIGIETPFYSDRIDTTQNLQVTAVRLSAPEGFVPGTASCSISAFGDISGLVFETAISNNPEALLHESVGCGVQHVMRLASTLYTMRYLKVTGRLTADREAKGNEFIRRGYGNQLSFRKNDGSYVAYQTKPTSTWLTAFVMKVFCEANTVVHIDENVIYSGVQWLIRNQEPDGSYAEKHPMYHVGMMDGIEGNTLMTAFALLALEECECDEEGLLLAKTRAVAYLETHFGNLNKSLPVATVAYALALADSDMKQAAYDRLQSMAVYNADNNWMYWITDNSAQDIETAGYGLLTQLLFSDMGKSKAIVNWLNTKQIQSGSTLDKVVALQALTEYVIWVQLPPINLVSNISLSNDKGLHEVLTFNKENALILQEVKIDKIGGTLYIYTTGQGMASLSVKLRYNVIQPVEDVCEFDVTVNVTDVENVNEIWNRDDGWMDRRGEFSEGQIPDSSEHQAGWQNQGDNNKVKMNIALCVRYLGNTEAGMSVVDVGIFSGFEPVTEDLKKLERDPTHLISSFEISRRGVVFFLDKVPIVESYCFSFHVIRQYLVGNTQMGAIKVYDYYNPDATCTKFYSPDRNSSLLSSNCGDVVCECAKGGCPPAMPFSEIPVVNVREWLEIFICEEHDYAWIGSLKEAEHHRYGFVSISFNVEDVIKEGIEKAGDIENKTRTLLIRENCEKANFVEGQTYIVIGRDSQLYQNENGGTWYRYLLDQTSVVYQWSKNIRQSSNKRLYRYLRFVIKKLKENGCELWKK